MGFSLYIIRNTLKCSDFNIYKEFLLFAKILILNFEADNKYFFKYFFRKSYLTNHYYYYYYY